MPPNSSFEPDGPDGPPLNSSVRCLQRHLSVVLTFDWRINRHPARYSVKLHYRSCKQEQNAIFHDCAGLNVFVTHALLLALGWVAPNYSFNATPIRRAGFLSARSGAR